MLTTASPPLEGIEAAHQRFPDEKPYCYQPHVGEEDQNCWNEETRRTIIKDYNLLDMYI